MMIIEYNSEHDDGKTRVTQEMWLLTPPSQWRSYRGFFFEQCCVVRFTGNRRVREGGKNCYNRAVEACVLQETLKSWK